MKGFRDTYGVRHLRERLLDFVASLEKQTVYLEHRMEQHNVMRLEPNHDIIRPMRPKMGQRSRLLSSEFHAVVLVPLRRGMCRRKPVGRRFDRQ